MVLENKLGITEGSVLACEEERLSKKKAIKLFTDELLKNKEIGKFSTLAIIHQHLFEEIYDFAGKVRNVNIAKGDFCFAPVISLDSSLKNINEMPQSSFEEIVEKYVEMNIAHPFREGNGRVTRLWLDHILKNQIQKVIDWNKIDKEDYLLAMQRSPIRDIEIKHVLREALISEIDDREIYMEGLDASYYYEGYIVYNSKDLF